MRLYVETFTDASGFDRLAAEWDDLLERSVSPSIFLTHRWQRIWWQHLGHGALALVTVRTKDGTLVGIAPFLRAGGTSRSLSFVGCVDVSDYLDLIVDAAMADSVYEALWDYLLGDSAPVWESLNLCNIPERSPTYRRLAELATASNYRVEVSVDDVCPVITLPSSWDDYLATLDKKQRHELRRKLRRAEEAAAVRWYVSEGGPQLERDIESFITLHQKSTAEKEGFWDEAMKAFFRTMATEFAAAGWLKLYFVEFNGERAATYLCFDYRNELLVYNSGYDPARFAALSPGIVLTAHMIDHAIQLGRTRLDFLRGDEEYKFRFGAVAEPVYRIHVQRPAVTH